MKWFLPTNTFKENTQQITPVFQIYALNNSSWIFGSLCQQGYEHQSHLTHNSHNTVHLEKYTSKTILKYPPESPTTPTASRRNEERRWKGSILITYTPRTRHQREQSVVSSPYFDVILVRQQHQHVIESVEAHTLQVKILYSFLPILSHLTRLQTEDISQRSSHVSREECCCCCYTNIPGKWSVHNRGATGKT